MRRQNHSGDEYAAAPGAENDERDENYYRSNARDPPDDRDRDYRDQEHRSSYYPEHRLSPQGARYYPDTRPADSDYSHPQYQQPHYYPQPPYYYPNPMAIAPASEESKRDSTRRAIDDDAAASASYNRPDDHRGDEDATVSSQTFARSEIYDYNQPHTRNYPSDEHVRSEHVRSEHVRSEHVRSEHVRSEHVRSEQGVNNDYHPLTYPNCPDPYPSYGYYPQQHIAGPHSYHSYPPSEYAASSGFVYHTEHTSTPHQGHHLQRFEETPSAIPESTTPTSARQDGVDFKPSARYAGQPSPPRERSLEHPTPPAPPPPLLPPLKPDPEGLLMSEDSPPEHRAASTKQEIHSSCDYEPIPYNEPAGSLLEDNQADRRAPEGEQRSSTDSAPSGEGNSWERRFDQLRAYKSQHGNCSVPQQYTENTSLGIWVNKQRMEHKNFVDGKRSSINSDRIRRLEELGFTWAKRKGQASWDEKFKELLDYKTENKTCHVPTKYRQNSALGRWVSTQRSEYKKFKEGDKSSMSPTKIKMLEGIGFAWNMACN